MEYKELKNIVQSKDKFIKFLINLLKNTDTGDIAGDKGVPLVSYGYADGHGQVSSGSGNRRVRR